MPKTRDSQRSKLYTAEFTCPWYKTAGRMESVEECQAFVDKVVASDWLHREFAATAPWVKIVVEDGRGRRSACAYTIGNRISMPVWSRSRAIVLHELAHHVVDDTYRRDYKRRQHTHGSKAEYTPPAAHGWEFAACQLALVRHFMGVKEHDELREAFRKHKVRYKARRVLSPEQRAASAARFAAMREGRRVVHDLVAASAKPIVSWSTPARNVQNTPRSIHIPDCPR